MNRHQRNSNRLNARRLASAAHAAMLEAHVCENCGEHGGHWINAPGFGLSLEDILTGNTEPIGFWTCPKLYGPDGRRIAP